MGKRILFVMIMLMLVFALSGVSYAWQGRMGGMEDPFGLVVDESDYLIHPAKIANGEGVRFYGDYRFTYNGVTDWSKRYNVFDLSGGLATSGFADVSGQELGNSALVGAAFPVWLGRMGLFFTYDGMRGDYDGSSGGARDALKNNQDAFAVRLLYGFPIGGSFKLGAEAQLAYRHEVQELDTYVVGGEGTEAWLNTIFTPPYPFPNDSSYLEALFKGSMEGKIGPLDLEFTLRGGLVLPGTNSSEWDYLRLLETSTENGWNTGGEVQGWRIGGDLWLRYTLAQDLTLPFLVRADYQQKTRDGFGPAVMGGYSGSFSFRDEVENLTITIGGGVDKEFGKATRIAAGIYYNYLQGRENFSSIESYPMYPIVVMTDYTYPDAVEHQLLLRLAGEHILSPAVALRAGVSLFYGWVMPEAKYARNIDVPPSPVSWVISDEGSGHGYDWGIGASLGGTIKFKPLTLEPFVGGGYRQRHLQVHGVNLYETGLTFFPSDVIVRNEWLVNAGLSILYDL